MTISPHIAEESSLPRVFGRYLLIQRLSSGGMGEIFLAKHGLSGFEKLCVIKKVLPELNADEHFLSRFVDEAQVAIHLQHANVAQVFEVGRAGDEYFLALEYVEGRDLRRCLGELDEHGQRFPLDMALLIARDLANGLAYAHRRTGPDGEPLELVHCDISPPNVLISFEGEVKIIDFGIAKSSVQVTETDPKIGFGKFGYMAPEQIMRGGVIDHRTDIYAAGVILFELLTGERLYTVGESPDYRELAKKVVTGQHPSASELDAELAPYDAIIERALAPKPRDRYQSAAELRDDIQHALVRLNPTISSDALGSFMRELFTDDLAEIQRLAALAKDADLAAWQAQLADQTATTVSFALLPDESEPDNSPAEQYIEPARKNPWHGVQPSVTDLVDPPPLDQPRRRGMFWVVALLLVLGAGGAIAMLVSQNKTSGARESSQPAPDTTTTTVLAPDPAPATAPATESNKAPTPTVAALTDSDLKGADHAAGAEPDAGVEDTGAESGQEVTKDQKPKARRSNPQTSRRKRHTRVNKPEMIETIEEEDLRQELTRAQVEAKFRAVNREYRDFQKNHGSALADRWAALQQAVKSAQSPDNLRDVATKLDRFRTAMRTIKATGDH